MKIILFNTLHNGDQFFTKEFVRRIVNNNPSHDFSIICRQFYTLYGDIKNLKVITRPEIKDFNTSAAEEIDYSKKYYMKGDTLYINTSLSLKEPDKQQVYICQVPINECGNNEFETIINDINTLNIEPKLVFNKLTLNEYIPSVLDGMKIDDLPPEIQSAIKTPCIFYYNLAMLSSSHSGKDDNKNIEAISTKYPGYTVIVPKETTSKGQNIICLLNLNIKEDNDGKNLLIYAYIASFCPIIISLETGGAQIIFNRYTLRTNNPQYIIYYVSQERENSIMKMTSMTTVQAKQKFFDRDNKHLVPLYKYDTETLLAEIEKIGEIQAARLPLESSGGSRAAFRSRYISKRYTTLKQKHKIKSIYSSNGRTKTSKYSRNMRFRKRRASKPPNKSHT
jgi:hypothetical protein